MAESVERRGGARAAAGHSSVTLSAVQCREWRDWRECRSAEVQKCRRVHNIFSEKSPDTVAAAAR